MAVSVTFSPEQAAAVEPTKNIVVQANAGTGKTFVLVQRLLRILFREFPNKSGILCLTYTNAGASEMRNRVLEAITNWAMASDSDLREMLRGIAHDQTPTNDDLKKARKIFYDFIDHPEILKIQTIHSFAEDILRRFPIESEVPPAWRLLSGAEQKRVLKDAFAEMINKPQSAAVQSAFDNVFDLISEYSLDDLLSSILSQYRRILLLKHNFDFTKHIIEKTKIFLGIDKPIEKPDSDINPDDVLTKEGQIRKKLSPELAAIAEDIYAWDQYQKNVEIFQISRDYLILCDAFADSYITLKNRRGLLDFDDILYKTMRLFNNPAQMGQVLSQLDFNLKHILIDEAQDNSPVMWDIIFAMLDDFMTDGEKMDPRTLFVVGDAKQSIFSFQGADPNQLGSISEKIGTMTKNRQRQCETVSMTESRRTSQAILGVVDFFFNNAGLPYFQENIKHRTWRANDFGLVEIHPLEKKQPDEETSRTRKRFVFNVAEKIESLIKAEDISASDIMVLLQRRDPFGPMLVRELKRRNIPTSGSDRIVLPDFPAVRDLLNVARFAIDGNYDAALAFVLRGPLFRLGEKELQELCIGRDLGRPLIEVVQNKLPDIYVELSKIRGLAHLQPYSFMSRILNRYRSEMIAAAGQIAVEPLDEFMTLALSYERTQAGGLAGFIRWFLDGENEIKRDMERGNGVRILTTHASKGLEAPIVFLIDTTKNPKSRAKQFPFSVMMPQPDIFLCKSGDVDSDRYKEAKEIELEKRTAEYWRLLYVAMTRARDRLYVFGCEEVGKNDSWHSELSQIVGTMSDATKDERGVISVSGGVKKSDKNHAKPPESQILTLTNNALKDLDIYDGKFENMKSNISEILRDFEQKKYSTQQGSDVHRELQFLDLDSDNELAVKIKSSPALERFWQSGSKTEVPLAGFISGKFESVRIDRMIESENEIEFLDYKTDVTHIRRDEYVKKMQKYASFLGQAFPKKKIIGHILWLNEMALDTVC